jgi:hypothetical protein
MLKRLLYKWTTARRLLEFNKAVAIVEAAGYTVCQIEYRSNVAYIVDANGAWRRIGKMA